MSFWRNFIKVIFKISLVVSSIGVVVLSLISMGGNFLIGLLVLVGGALAVLLLHGIIGVMLELCDNVARMTEIAERVNYNTSPSDTLNKLSAIAGNDGAAASAPSRWKCPKCGESNDSARMFCGSCGAGKE